MGKITIAVSPQYTSQNCSSCGETVKKTLSERTHIYKCGCILDRVPNELEFDSSSQAAPHSADENAALNILAKGLSTTGHVGTNAWGQDDLYLAEVTKLDKLTG